MSIEGKMNAAAKNVEGKAEATLGKLLGDQDMELEGQTKQVQAAAMNTVENLKDAAKNALDNIKGAIDKA